MMSPRASRQIACALISLLLVARVDAVQIKAIEFSGLDEVQVLNVRNQLSLAQAQIKPDVVVQISETRLSYLLDLAPHELRQGLEAFGYYDADVQSVVKRDGESVSVLFTVTPGKPVQVRKLSLRVAGEAEKDPEIIKQMAAFEPKQGEVFHQGKYESSKIAISRALNERGYFDTKLITHRVEVTRADHAADIDLDWSSGSRFRFAEVRFEGEQFEPGLLEQLVPWKLGDIYNQSQLLALQKTLANLDYFGSISVQPLPDQAHNGEVPVQIIVTPAKRSIYSIGLRFGTDTGPGVASSLERRWVNAKGHKLFLDFNIARELSDFTAQYRVPAFSRFEGWYGFLATLRDEDYNDIPSQISKIALSRTGRWHDWNLNGALELARERYSYGNDADELYSTIVAPVISAERIKADDINTPRKGYRLLLEASSGLQAIGSDINFVQAVADIRYIHGAGLNNRILLHGQLGAIRGDEFALLPPSQRYYAGGDRSIRGYGFREIGPVQDGLVVGGQYLAIASVEFEHMFSATWGGAAFVDAGDAYNQDFQTRIGIGLGVRWRSPVGPIRFDLAHGLNDPEQAYRFHITIGPDL